MIYLGIGLVALLCIIQTVLYTRWMNSLERRYKKVWEDKEYYRNRWLECFSAYKERERRRPRKLETIWLRLPREVGISGQWQNEPLTIVSWIWLDFAPEKTGDQYRAYLLTRIINMTGMNLRKISTSELVEWENILSVRCGFGGIRKGSSYL